MKTGIKNNKVPQLRFPGFEYNWVEKKLGEAFINSRKKGNNTLPIYSVSQERGLFPRDSLNRSVQKDADSDQNLVVDQYDIVYNMMRMWQGAIGIAEVECMVSPAYIVLRPKQKESSLFYNYLFAKKRSIYLFWAYSYGLTNDRLRLYFKDFARIKTYGPVYEEQTKIANFLTAVDKRINLLKKKKAELEQYKKGIMQQLFSQTIRFKDDNGKNFPDWEEKNLGEIGTFQTSSVDKLSKENEEQVFLVNYMNVYRHENINNSTRENLQVVTAKENQINSSGLKRGDILFTPSSETPTDIGHSVVIFEDLENTLFSYHLMRFRPNIELDLLYSHYFCNIPPVLKQLSSFSTGSTRFTISVGNFSKVKVQLPSFEEQKKIANFLSSIDKSIEKVSCQIDKSVTFKQGLLQKMFV